MFLRNHNSYVRGYVDILLIKTKDTTMEITTTMYSTMNVATSNNLVADSTTEIEVAGGNDRRSSTST